MSLQAPGNTDPGQLDRRIVLQTRTTTRDAVGGKVEAWGDVATVYAMRTVDSGRRYFGAEQENAEEIVTFRIRWRTGVVAFMRVVYADQFFEIVQKPVELGRRAYLELVTRSIREPVSNFSNDFSAEFQ